MKGYKMFLKKVAYFLIICAVPLFYGGCASSSEKMPGISIPTNQMNQEIQLIPDPGGGLTPKNNNYYDFQIKNLSDKAFTFSGDFGVKIFYQKAGEWIAVQNMTTYPDKEVVLPTTKIFPPGQIVPIFPLLPEMNQPETIRIVVVGHVENTTRLAGAYVDLVLNP
jgi:hypothetical protein